MMSNDYWRYEAIFWRSDGRLEYDALPHAFAVVERWHYDEAGPWAPWWGDVPRFRLRAERFALHQTNGRQLSYRSEGPPLTIAEGT